MTPDQGFNNTEAYVYAKRNLDINKDVFRYVFENIGMVGSMFGMKNHHEYRTWINENYSVEDYDVWKLKYGEYSKKIYTKKREIIYKDTSSWKKKPSQKKEEA